jgi:hypothetical protein
VRGNWLLNHLINPNQSPLTRIVSRSDLSPHAGTGEEKLLRRPQLRLNLVE